jgi:hypothetical protein
MGEHAETVAANIGGENWFGSSQAQDFSSRQEENRGGAKGEMGCD